MSDHGFVSFVMKWMVAGLKSRPLKWGVPGNKTDVFVKGDADDSCLRFAELLGWKHRHLEKEIHQRTFSWFIFDLDFPEDDLLEIQSTRNAELDRQFEAEQRKSSR
ncbi:hypothetical protein ACTXT7_011986 [Hymenolepis weldensis]